MSSQRAATILLGLLCLMLCLPGVSQAGDADLATLAEALNLPAVGGPVKAPEAITLGHAEITLRDGGMVREILAGSKRCGVLIDGPAWLLYRVDDPMSVPVAERNIKRASRISTNTAEDGSISFGINLKGAVIWSWDYSLPAAAAGAAPASAAVEAADDDTADDDTADDDTADDDTADDDADEGELSEDEADAAADEAEDDEPEVEGALPKWARKLLDRPFYTTPASEMLNARGLGAKGAFYALLRTSKEDLLLVVDPAEAKVETLYRLERVDYTKSIDHGRHHSEELAAQPIGRRWQDRFPAPTVAIHEAISVDNYEGENARVETSSVIQTTRSGVGIWRVGLVERTWDEGMAYDKVYPVEVVSAKVNGTKAAFTHEGDDLLIELDPPLVKGAKVTVEVVDVGRFAWRPQNGSFFYLGTYPWYPQPPSNGEFATVDLSLRVPEELTPFATGDKVSLETADGFTTLKTHLDRPVQYPVMAAGKYKLFSDEHNGVTCRVASYVFGKERACERLLTNFFAAADLYGSLFGVAFPFEEMDVVEVNTWGFGQAPAGIIFITKEAYEPLTDWMNAYFSSGVNERFVHEVAHTWWGHVVKYDSREEQWLSESFAEYSAALCLEAAKGGGRKGRREFNALLKGWKARARLVGDGDSIYLANHLAGHDDKDHDDRINLLYSKGPLVIHAIRQELQRHYGSEKEGDRYFVLLLSAINKNFEFKWATTQHLIGILGQMTGSSWQPFFDRYVYGTETPEVDT